MSISNAMSDFCWDTYLPKNHTSFMDVHLCALSGTLALYSKIANKGITYSVKNRQKRANVITYEW